MQLNAPVAFIAINLSQSAGESSLIERFGTFAPAQFISKLSCLNCLLVHSNKDLTLSRSETSTVRVEILLLPFLATSSNLDCLRPATITFTPSLANAIEMASPIPVPPPITTAFCPERVIEEGHY